MATVSPLRPRLVIRVAEDGSLDFAGTSDVEVIIVHERFRNFRVFPALAIGIEQVRRLLGGQPDVSVTPQSSHRESAL